MLGKKQNNNKIRLTGVKATKYHKMTKTLAQIKLCTHKVQ